MKNATEVQHPSELDQLCASVRALVRDKAYGSCMEPICRAMANYPDAPQPHNLLGIVLEKTGDHASAMKHFRAAWALDPTYRPTNHNLCVYGTFYSCGKCAFDESDMPTETESAMETDCDRGGTTSPAKKWKIEYDRHGIGHAVRR